MAEGCGILTATIFYFYAACMTKGATKSCCSCSKINRLYQGMPTGWIGTSCGTGECIQ